MAIGCFKTMTLPPFTLLLFVVQIRIGKAEFLHDVTFQLFHLLGLVILGAVLLDLLKRRGWIRRKAASPTIPG